MCAYRIMIEPRRCGFANCMAMWPVGCGNPQIQPFGLGREVEYAESLDEIIPESVAQGERNGLGSSKPKRTPRRLENTTTGAKSC